MKKLGMMLLILLGAMMLLGQNYALAKGPHGDMGEKARFDAMDTDKDGKVSMAEYTAKCQDRFRAMDTNKDGFLTSDECGKVWGEHKEIMKEKMQKGHSYRHTGAPSSATTPGED